MKLEKIEEIRIFSPGDTSVGIQDFDACIENVDILVQDLEWDDLQRAKSHIKKAFEALGMEKVKVSYKFGVE